MSHLPLSERDIERLLEGNVPSGRGDLTDLARLFARVRSGVDGESVPPMSARLLAELDAAELSGRLQSELERAAERRRVQRGRRRWRAVAAAAAIVVIGGAVIASVRGPLGDDLRTRPGDDPVSVAEPDASSSTTTDSGSTGGVETADPEDSSSPIFSDDAEDPSGDLGIGSESSSGVATTVPPADPPPDASAAGDVDWGEVSNECGPDYECWIDAAEKPCQEAGVECWAAAAEACDDDYTCRYMLANMCGDTDECRAAIYGGPPQHRGH